MAHSFPQTCKAVVLKKPGDDWVLSDIPVPQPAENEVLVKVHACGVCAADLGLQEGHFGSMASFPTIPGHEAIGTVVSVGAGEKKWKVGDLVGATWHGGHDNTCTACKRGSPQMCDNESINGVKRNGGYAEYVCLRSEAVVGIPPGSEIAETAPLLCAGVTVFNGIRNMNVRQGDTVVIQGLGGLGHLALQFARKMGYRVVAVSRNADKKEFATRMGANDYIDTSKEDAAEAIQKLGGAALVVITAPNPKVMGSMVNALHARGKVLILAPVGEISVDTVPLISKGLSVHGWPSGSPLDCEEAIAFANRQTVKCQIETFPFSEVKKAVEHTGSGKVRFRSVLIMDEKK